MINLKYLIHEVKPNIFAVEVKDDYHLAMLFLRVQEFYESPNPRFRGNHFSIWEFIEWYSKEKGGSFTYASDWAGFNIPYDVLRECYFNVIAIETPYDAIMQEILATIAYRKGEGKAYIIGVPDIHGETFLHEVCHGLYYTDSEYKETADKITGEILQTSPGSYYSFKKNLLEMGYTDEVIDDEIQAYLSTNWENRRFGQEVDKSVRRKFHNQYTKKLEKYILDI
jgi:hypothetical protein